MRRRPILTGNPARDLGHHASPQGIPVARLIGLFVWVVRKYGGMSFAPQRADRRLGIVETLPLDPKHRLILVRRDGVEHLLLLGAQDDVLVESGITPLAATQAIAPLPAREGELPEFLRRPSEGRQIGLGEIRL